MNTIDQLAFLVIPEHKVTHSIKNMYNAVLCCSCKNLKSNIKILLYGSKPSPVLALPQFAGIKFFSLSTKSKLPQELQAITCIGFKQD